MKIFLRLFAAVHAVIAAFFVCASLLIVAIAARTGWGVFIRLNRYAEELEPEAMAEAKSEDKKLE